MIDHWNRMGCDALWQRGITTACLFRRAASAVLAKVMDVVWRGIEGNGEESEASRELRATEKKKKVCRNLACHVPPNQGTLDGRFLTDRAVRNIRRSENVGTAM